MWPSRLLDLNPCDLFLFGYLKSVVYNPLPKKLDDLKANIVRETKQISKMLQILYFLYFEKRCNSIISADGGHIEEK